MPKIKLLDTGFDSFDYEENLFKSHGYNFEIWQGEKGDVAGKIKFAVDAEGLLIRWTLIDDEFLAQMNGLKAIARYGVGFENIDLDAITRFGVKAANVQGYGNHSVSDHALAMMYSCNRLLLQGYREIRDTFSNPPDKRVLDFHTCTLGIIGLGRIGGTLCRKATHLFREVIAYDPFIENERFQKLGARKVTLVELMETSNVISIHCDHNETSENLLNQAAYAMTKKCPIVINTARGPIVNQEALIDALNSHQIFSAGIDVFNTELAHELPEDLLNHPKILCTGHYAWYSIEAHQELQKRAADNLLALLQGKEIEDCLNP